MAIIRLRNNDTEGRAYYRYKVAAGKTNMETLRCLKRRLSNAVYKKMPTPGRQGQTGRTTGSDTSIQRGQHNPDS